MEFLWYTKKKEEVYRRLLAGVWFGIRRKERLHMDDKKLYNKVMLIAFCLIIVLLAVGLYSKSKGTQIENFVPFGVVKEV